MGPLVFGISLLVLLVGFVMLIYYFIARKPKTLAKYLLIAGVVLFVVSLFLPGPKEDTTSPDESVDYESEEKKQEEETEDKEPDEKREQGEKENKPQEEKDEPTKSETKEQDNPPKEESLEEEKSEPKTTQDSKQKEKEKQSPSNPNLDTATVSRVVDGDTIEIRYNGKIEDVRLLLVDTPETVHPSKPVQPYGPEASSFAKQTLSGKQVQIEFDGPKRDKYDRLLAYIWLGGKMFNQMLLEKGLARLAYVYDPPYTHYDAYVKAQTKAVNAKKGIWSKDGYVTEDGFASQEEGTSNSSGDSANSEVPDRDCGDFDTHKEAQAFFETQGGPNKDPHRLDRDGNGLACESLP
ncbi:thermonuclease family protein [Salinibacillus xinjiangensis]|uniref:thermonuclease family protein n=1 Tax=Salinibacillus xinjiangensis TaxID=1229268 RepID=UPI00129A4952|nr:thermonuclease family protein [Salinibacillus xinjiangensis]